MAKLKIEKMVLGMVKTNTWFIQNEETKEILLVDPASDAQHIRQKAEENGWKIQAILLTHGHFDHIGAVEALKKQNEGLLCYAGEKEENLLKDPQYNLSASFERGFSIEADRLVREKEVLHLAGFEIRVFETPGHTEGSVCYYLPKEGVLFSGDTLFHTNVGRTDFPTGSMSKIVHSVRRLTEELPEDTIVYPGHDAVTQIAYEKKYNPYL